MTKDWMGRLRFVLVTATVVACVGMVGRFEIAAQPQAQPAAESREADKTAIKELVGKFVAALEKQDAAALAACFTAEGEYVPSTGDAVQGTEALAKAFGQHFAQAPAAKVTVESMELRFLSKDSAMERGRFAIRPERSSEPLNSRYSALFVRDGSEWKLGMLREREDKTVALGSLEWLVGDWQMQTEGKQAAISYDWAHDKKFLRSQYSVTEGDHTRSGSQVIGLDPSKTSLRGWTFDSQGGFGESHWRKDGDHWLIGTQVTLPDGSVTKATNVMTRIDENTFTWQATQRSLNDAALDDLPPVKVVRVTNVAEKKAEQK